MDEKRRYDEGLEVAPAPAAPEVVPYQLYKAQPPIPGQQPHPIAPAPTTPPNAFSPVYNTTPTTYNAQSNTLGAYSGAYSHPSSPSRTDALPATLVAGEDYDNLKAGSQRRPNRTICGCGVLVFVLCAVIALLGAACIGLAAGTGLEASRANDARESLAAMSAGRVTVTAPAAASATASFNEMSRGCSNDPGNVTGQSYTAPKGLGAPTFTIYCNKDATGINLMALFVSSLETCMDACAAFSFYEPTNFGATHANATCRSVSFIPLWMDKAKALAGDAPGNCYLKPGGNVSGLATPNIGTECHAAVVSGR